MDLPTNDQRAAERGIQAFDNAVRQLFVDVRQFVVDVTAPVWAPVLRWRRRIGVVATHEIVAGAVFDDKVPDAEDHVGYRVRFVEIAREGEPSRAELLELAEVVDGLVAYGDNPLPRLVRAAETPIVIRAPEPAPMPQVQGFAGLPIPGIGMVWKAAAIGATAAAVAGWGAYGVQQVVVMPRLEKMAEKNAGAAAELAIAKDANQTLARKLDRREAELTAARSSINETAERAAAQLAAAQRRWMREREAMLAAVEASRRAVDEARAGSSSRSNDEWMRDNGLKPVDPGAGPGAASATGTP